MQEISLFDTEGKPLCTWYSQYISQDKKDKVVGSLITVLLEATCPGCGREFTPRKYQTLCNSCGG